MELRRPAVESVLALNAELQGWLVDRALPLWDEHGIDCRSGGGYFEHLHSATGGRPGACKHLRLGGLAEPWG